MPERTSRPTSRNRVEGTSTSRPTSQTRHVSPNGRPASLSATDREHWESQGALIGEQWATAEPSFKNRTAMLRHIDAYSRRTTIEKGALKRGAAAAFNVMLNQSWYDKGIRQGRQWALTTSLMPESSSEKIQGLDTVVAAQMQHHPRELSEIYKQGARDGYTAAVKRAPQTVPRSWTV